MKEFLFFSNNKNKILEASRLLDNRKIKFLNLNDFKKIKSPKETGVTFEENAKIKSIYGLINFNKYCFADDSGICIDAMGGKPGVWSKKYLLSEKKPNDILNKIIKIAHNKKNFNAYFQTTICLALSKEKIIFFNGTIKGKISNEIRGDGGFGYDPIFIPKKHNITFAEMSIDQKIKISHRSIALSKLIKYLQLI